MPSNKGMKQTKPAQAMELRSLSQCSADSGGGETRVDIAQYRGNVSMAIAQSRLTAQGQISVPAAVRRKLGDGPGLDPRVARGGREHRGSACRPVHIADLHEALFAGPPKRRSLAELKEGLKTYAKRRHARR